MLSSNACLDIFYYCQCNIAMAKSVLTGADNDVISFDLQDIFDENAGNIDVFNKQDDKLGALMDQVQDNFSGLLQNVQM